MAVVLGEAEAAAGRGQVVAGRSPWALAGRQLWRNRLAMASLALFLLIVAVSLAAPLYASHVAHVNPFANNLNGTTIVLGADSQGRDVAARVLYGGRSSLEVGVGSAVICCIIATVVALIAGFSGGAVDAGLSRLMDVIWAFPVYLLAISISTELLTTSSGLKIGPLHIVATSLWLPTLIIAVIFVPYVYRPVRGHVLTVARKEFAEAAIAQGASNLRLMFSDILPNVISVVIVLLPLIIATTILTEAALSFLGIGVQPPNASWGSIINDGQGLLYTRPWVAIAPGIMIVLTVLALNVLGDGVRDALDPRAKLRVEG